MKQVIAVISCALALVCLAGILPAAGQEDQVYVVDISGDVDPGMAAFVDRAFQEIPEGDHLVVLEMDTFGGRVDAALMIVDTIVNFDRGTTVALVTKKAISAGALIALACDQLAMRPHTTLGDCAPIMVSSEGPEMLGEKFQSPLRAKFRSLARKNGYPEVLAEAMVTADMEVLRLTTKDGTVYLDARDFQEWSEAEKVAVVDKKTVVARGELLTMDDVEARELGFSLMTAADRAALLAHLGAAGYEIVPVAPTWTEGLMRFIGTIAPLLMLIGLGALYTEIKAPGFGAPGIVGIICLTLFFMNQYTVGLAGYTELLIILLGFVLVAFELFVIPGFGIAGIAGILCIVVGLVLSLQGFVLPDPAMPWQMDLLVTNLVQVLGAIVLAFFISLALLRYVLPKMPVVSRGPYLNANLQNARAEAVANAGVVAGDRGVALTALHPSGKMKVGSRVYDVVTEGEFLEKGTPVVITAVRGNILIVAAEVTA